jgi:hypothetical protein
LTEGHRKARRTYNNSIDLSSRELILAADALELISGVLMRVLVGIK